MSLKYFLKRAVFKRGIAILCWCVVAATGTVASSFAQTVARDAESKGESAEKHLPADQTATPWIHDPAIFDIDEGDRRELRDSVESDVKTVKLDNLVPPIHFGLGEVEIPDNYLTLLKKVLDRMRDQANVRLHFIGHTDSLPLSKSLAAMYGDNVGLSRERAGTTAEYCQRALNLSPEAISYEGIGDRQPLAENATEKGRQMNRRVEVQVWY
ncbi:MAG: OmpA family protein, partial [Gammaproteobacteria bacterium]|nr:OmpA family protein [Gammaproteobacteria bacterium]